jgi:hypothetical protein
MCVHVKEAVSKTLSVLKEAITLEADPGHDLMRRPSIAE